MVLMTVAEDPKGLRWWYPQAQTHYVESQTGLRMPSLERLQGCKLEFIPIPKIQLFNIIHQNVPMAK